MAQPRRTNRGRGAAASNRQALLTAARQVFADVGLDAPLSAVAKTAGVGQGSLYRHFPDRIELALAVFEDNVSGMEILVADPTSTLDDLLTFLTERSIDSIAFVDMIASATDDPRLVEVVDRVVAALADKLDRERREGALSSNIGAEDLFLAVGMIANLLARTPASERRSTADRGWSILRRGLGLPGAD